MDWKLADAKNKLSEVVDRALGGEPQRITRRGAVVVVVDESQYLTETGRAESFIAFLKSGPGIDDLERPPLEALSIRPFDQ